MNDSFQLGRIFGIPVRVHWTFLLLLYVVAAFVGTSAGATLLFLAGLVLAVLLHELGHGLVARRLGIHVVDITFWPLGGMTNMSRVPEDSRIEGWIAAGGPVTNLVLAGIAALASFGLGAAGLPEAALSAGGFALINLYLGTLNLLPVFPMDGGRILRAWLARSSDWLSATERAVRIGRVFLIGLLLLFVASPLLGGGGGGSTLGTLCVLPVTAVFLWWSGVRELWAVRLRHGRSPFGTAAGQGTGPIVFGGSWPPGGPREVVEQEEEVDLGNARRPMTGDSVPQGGFSEDFVRDLERHRGRLRPRPGDGDVEDDGS